MNFYLVPDNRINRLMKNHKLKTLKNRLDAADRRLRESILHYQEYLSEMHREFPTDFDLKDQKRFDEVKEPVREFLISYSNRMFQRMD